MNRIVLNAVKVNENRISYDYEISGEWRRYFHCNAPYYIEYEESIADVPQAVLTVPFLANLLPVSWIFDAEIQVEEIDADFYNSISEFKAGYEKMYNTKFTDWIQVNNIVESSYQGSGAGAFYSGGIDATSTMVSHISESPLLINIQGADLSVDNEPILNLVKNRIQSIVDSVSLKITFVKSSFRNMFNYRFLDPVVEKRFREKYWYGFQHGVAIISHAAPLAYLHKLSKIYIASSNTEADGDVRCASDPKIDNFVKMSKTQIVHDQFDYDRRMKIVNIADYIEKNDLTLNLRVCLDTANPENCCHCEKCYRSIFEILVNGYNPSRFGFKIDDGIYDRAHRDFQKQIILHETQLDWERIKQLAIQNKQYSNKFTWIYDYDFMVEKHRLRKRAYAYYKGGVRRINRILKREN